MHARNILVLEPNDLLRAGLKTILEHEESVDIVYEERSQRDLFLYRSRLIDLVIINQTFVAKLLPSIGCNFVVISHEPNLAAMKTAYEQGARGYVTHAVSAQAIKALLAIEETAFFVEPILTPMLMKCLFDTRNSSYIKEELLTPREKEIVYLLRSGIDRDRIAAQLHIASATLKTHIKNIARKRELVSPS
ncbi:LuxR C-terminal-related transcriptional regulator [Dictyobacter kobayashii]|uniref:DNA-binding response regulator n=1 Tax=Dictyobacter kobayashii TaxID=2014872 RepID=A0A402AVD8_9CHLR|nr:LuxR C-terminal-related transcriptional regulator [Dictyobacter kobayashii]GCE23101.1 DNA-binding response regulator [Dictyobacter kobayashii]